MTADGKIELKKAEVDAALKDFNALASSIAASFTGGGLKVDAVVSGSLFARAGLQKGDIIVAIDGRPLRSLDDAADLYARAATLKALTVQVVRGGKPGSFQIAIR
jgi:S1-C subfamily serine protease